MSLRDFVPSHSLFLARMVARWKASRRGNIAVLTALLMAPIVGMMGLALDYGHLILVKSRLDQAALSAAGAAANAARNVVQSATRNMTNYTQTDFNTKAIDDGQTIGANIFKAQFGSTTPTVTVTVKRISNTFAAQVEYNASIETYFAKYFNVNVFNIRGQQSIITGMLDSRAQGSTPGSIIDERWDAPSASPGDSTKPVINDWYSGTAGRTTPLVKDGGPMIVGQSSSRMRVGSNNGSIPRVLSKKVYLPEGAYELRYWYRSTVVYPEYEPVFICGSVESEMHWVTSGATRTLGRNSDPVDPGGMQFAQTSRAGVYLVPILSNPQLATTAPPENMFPRPPSLPYNATTSPLNLRPDNSINRVDICTYSSNWIERSVQVTVTNAGYFWLSFVAEPPSSTRRINGFDLGRVQLCAGACTDALNKYWPWSANTVLYKDSFETPAKSHGASFDSTLSSFTSEAKYDATPKWDVGRYGGDIAGVWDPASFVYDLNSSPRYSGPTSVLSKRLGIWLYRRMLLMPGVYKISFKAGLARALPTMQWCLTPTTDASGVTVDKWILQDSSISSCVCPAGAITTVVVSDELIYGQANANLNNTSPEIYRNNTDAPGSAMSDCRTSGMVVTDQMCVLVPRTQYYGFQLRVQGPYDARVTGLASPNPQLDTGGVYLDDLEVRLLSPGVKNKFTGTISDPGDFDDYSTQCVSRLGAQTQQATKSNIISGGVPAWPGQEVPASAYKTPPERIKVTAPSN